MSGLDPMAWPRGGRRGELRAYARGLGWLSLGLGLSELLFPRALARGVGMRRGRPLLSLFGLREIATGAGALLARDPEPWIWGRLAGDALDIATLLAGAGGSGARRIGAGAALATVLGVTFLDLMVAEGLRDLRQYDHRRMPDYGDRSGFPKGVQESRGAARAPAPR
jgi:hypothetical protein